jgi:molybdopterin-biosynthesis enzyme MoeA-like protein
VLAGVPMIMRAMLEAVAPLLPQGAKVHSITIAAPIGEGSIAPDLAAIQKAHGLVAIGSYPQYSDAGYGVQLVVRGRDMVTVEAAARAIEAMLQAHAVAPQRAN